MESPLAGTENHLGAHKEKLAFGCKTGAPADTTADFSPVKVGKQTPEICRLDDSSLREKQVNQAVATPEDYVLTGTQAPQMRAAELQPGKQEPAGADAVNFPTEKQAPEHILTEPRVLPEVERVGINTAPSVESVEEAFSYFVERMNQKPQQQVLYEGKATTEFDAQKAYEEVGHYQELLSKEEASIAEVLLELEKAKEQIQMCKGEEPGSLGNGEGCPPSNQPEEILDVGVPQELYVKISRELELARMEIENVYKERTQLESLKQLALKEREAAFSALEAATTRIKELVAKQASSQEELGASNAALAEMESEIDALRLTASVELDGKSMNDVGGLLHASTTQFATLKSLDVNLSEAGTLIGKLKEELATIREAKTKASSSNSNPEDELTTVKLRLEQAKTAEGDSVAAIGRILEELDEAKMNLTKVTQDGAPLASAVTELQAEVVRSQAELESARETQQIACATLASLQDELCSIRNLVLSAHASEVRAREAKKTNPIEYRQLATEADQAKIASKLAIEEAQKGTRAVEQAKAAMITAVSRLHAARKEAEAARASEAMAAAQFTALSEPEDKPADLKEVSEAGKGAVNISLEEYRALIDTGNEAEAAANEKVAAVLVQVETAKARQKTAQEELDAATNELEVLQKAVEEAQKKADDAQTAKMSVEADLRKWRGEHDQRRRTGSNPSSVSTSAAQSPRMNNKPSSQGRHSSVLPSTPLGSASLGSLAEVLSVKLPPAEKAFPNLLHDDVVKKPEKVKKRSFFSIVMAMFARKKSKSRRKDSITKSSIF